LVGVVFAVCIVAVLVWKDCTDWFVPGLHGGWWLYLGCNAVHSHDDNYYDPQISCDTYLNRFLIFSWMTRVKTIKQRSIADRAPGQIERKSSGSQINHGQ